MSVLNKIFGSESTMEKETEGEKEPEFKQERKYRICIEDNPNELKYRYCGKKNIAVPNCKLSLYLEELTHVEVTEIELEILNVLERHDFVMR
jgi:hypothetical protein